MWPRKLKEMPRVKAVMTPFPYSIEKGQPVETAREMMVQHRIHHLPVMADGNPTGVISYRDLQRTLNQGPGREGEPLTVAAVPLEEVHVVDLSEPLDRVLLGMADKYTASALVVKDGKLAGIFTITDACRRFGDLLRSLFPAGGDDAA